MGIVDDDTARIKDLIRKGQETYAKRRGFQPKRFTAPDHVIGRPWWVLPAAIVGGAWVASFLLWLLG